MSPLNENDFLVAGTGNLTSFYIEVKNSEIRIWRTSFGAGNVTIEKGTDFYKVIPYFSNRQWIGTYIYETLSFLANNFALFLKNNITIVNMEFYEEGQRISPVWLEDTPVYFNPDTINTICQDLSCTKCRKIFATGPS